MEDKKNTDVEKIVMTNNQTKTNFKTNPQTSQRIIQQTNQQNSVNTNENPKKISERDYVEPELVVDEFLLKSKTIENQKQTLRKVLNMNYKEQTGEKTNFYRKLKVKLYKAGIESEPEQYVKKLMLLSVIILCLSIFALGLWLFFQPINWKITILILFAFWFVGFGIIFYLSKIFAFVYLDYKAFKRTKEVEKVLPEYLRLVATNYRSGLPLDKALMASNRPRFGILSKEIEQVAKTTRVKGDFAKSLEIFGKKFDSKILERSMNSISMSVRSGSNISQLLDEIANNITKMRNMQASMAANVKNYVIFIVVSGIIIAPLMFAMSYQMNLTISGVKNKLDVQSDGMQTGALQLTQGGGVNLNNLDVFSILMILTNCVVSSLVISMIRYGNFQQGIKNIFMYSLISISIYIIGKIIISSLIGVV